MKKRTKTGQRIPGELVDLADELKVRYGLRTRMEGFRLMIPVIRSNDIIVEKTYDGAKVKALKPKKLIWQ